MKQFDDLVNRLKEGREADSKSAFQRGSEEGKKDFFDFRFEDFSAMRTMFQNHDHPIEKYTGNEPELIALYEQFKMHQLGSVYHVKIEGKDAVQGSYSVYVGGKHPLEGKGEDYRNRYLKGWLQGAFTVWKDLPRDLF